MNTKQAIAGLVKDDVLDGNKHEISTTKTGALVGINRLSESRVLVDIDNQLFSKSDLIELRDLITAIIEDGRVE